MLFSNDCNVLSNVTMYEYPYPMAIAKPCLPEDIYAELAATRPSWETIAGDKRDLDNKRVDICGMRAYVDENTPQIWKDFLSYHMSPAFYVQIVNRFNGFFEQYYPDRDFTKYKPAPRNSDVEGDIYLDCQIGINTPAKTRSTVSKPHLDGPESVWAAMLYMKEPDDDAGGHLRFHKCRDLPVEIGERIIDEKGLIDGPKVMYNPNTFVAFVNSPFSIHSVSPREVTDKPRLFVNFTLELKGAKFFSMERMKCPS